MSDCSGSGACITETAQSEEQDGEQTGEYWTEEDTNGTPVRGSGAGAGSWIVEQRWRFSDGGHGHGANKWLDKSRARTKKCKMKYTVLKKFNILNVTITVKHCTLFKICFFSPTLIDFLI